MPKRKADANGTPKPTDDEAMRQISRALGDPRRFEVLRRIAACKASTCTDVREGMVMSPATLSHHMKQLEAAGLIETVRDGKYVRSQLRRKTWKAYLGYLKALAP